MKSLEFVNETEVNMDNVAQIQNMFDLPTLLIYNILDIKKDCQPYLNENKDPLYSPLYRGLGKKISDPMVTKTVRLDDRKPSDTPQQLHDVFNSYFTKHHGHPFRNAMFVSGSDIEASGYGKVYKIFPIGDYNYVWSSDIDDLWMTFDNWTAEEGYRYDDNNEYLSFLNEVVKKAQWHTDNLKAAIDSKHEIMMRCGSYHAIDERFLNKHIEGIEALLEL